MKIFDMQIVMRVVLRVSHLNRKDYFLNILKMYLESAACLLPVDSDYS